MPIKGLSEVTRLPRLGKIHLGIKAKNNKGVEYPKATDYFVLPQEHPDYSKLKDLFGDKPKTLRILIPVEDEETWCEQYFKLYSQTRGLICKGDGNEALRMVDIETGVLPTRETATVTMREMKCEGKDCPDYGSRKCSETMHLRFLIPEIPGLGVWQIDTGSINSILNINSCAKMIKGAFGRISLIPLTLSLEPIQVKNPEDGKVKTVHVLNLRTEVTLKQLAEVARQETKMLTVGELEQAFEVEVEKEIDELWGEKPSKTSEAKTDEAIIEGETQEDLFSEEEPVKEQQEQTDDDIINEEQLQHIDDTLKEQKKTLAQLGEFCNKTKGWNIRKREELTLGQYKEILTEFFGLKL